MKEIHGNIWKTGVIDQPAKEPDSYWIKFLDSSILRRTRSMIRPRSLPSHFKLETESKERNISEFIPSHLSSNFQSMLPGPEHPALPTGNLVTPQLSERGTSAMRKDIPTSLPGVTQPSISSQVLRRSTCTTNSVPPRRFLHPGNEHWNLVESSRRSFVLNSNQNWLFCFIQFTVWKSQDTHIV